MKRKALNLNDFIQPPESEEWSPEEEAAARMLLEKINALDNGELVRQHDAAALAANISPVLNSEEKYDIEFTLENGTKTRLSYRSFEKLTRQVLENRYPDLSPERQIVLKYGKQILAIAKQSEKLEREKEELEQQIARVKKESEHKRKTPNGET